MRLRRAEEIETLSHRTVVELNAESRLAPERRVATIARRLNVSNGWPASGPAAPTDRRQLQRVTRTERTHRPQQRRETEMVADAR